MKWYVIKKWLIRLLLLSIVMTFMVFLWVDYHIDDMWGEHTEVVDHQQFEKAQQKIVISNVSVLSADGEEMLANHHVLIDQGTIVSVSAQPLNIKDAVKINAIGQFLIPGLTDAHVHMWQSPNDLLLYVANGVTHVREMNGSVQHLAWKKAINNGRIGPKIYVASSRVNSNGMVKGWFEAWTAKIASVNENTDMDSFAGSLQKQGYDAIKVYTFINNHDYWRLLEAANKIGLSIVGHSPIGLTLDQLWQSGQKSLAHIEELVKALNREFGGYDTPNAEEFLRFVRKRSNAIAKHMAANDMAVVSTLWLMESFAKQKAELNNILTSVQLHYVNPGISEGSVLADRVMGWLPGHNIYRLAHEHNHQQLLENTLYWQTYAQANRILLKVLIDHGIKVMAGTDANVPVAVPGFSLHQELQSMVDVGLTNAQVLRTATSIPAEFMNIKSGKILPDYRADLLLLNANPLQNIANTEKIESVIINGRYYDRTELDKMLSAVKIANDHSRTVNISMYE